MKCSTVRTSDAIVKIMTGLKCEATKSIFMASLFKAKGSPSFVRHKIWSSCKSLPSPKIPWMSIWVKVVKLVKFQAKRIFSFYKLVCRPDFDSFCCKLIHKGVKHDTPESTLAISKFSMSYLKMLGKKIKMICIKCK